MALAWLAAAGVHAVTILTHLTIDASIRSQLPSISDDTWMSDFQLAVLYGRLPCPRCAGPARWPRWPGLSRRAARGPGDRSARSVALYRQTSYDGP